MNLIWDEKNEIWRNENGGRICTIDNETIQVVLDNCKDFVEKRDTIYLSDVRVLLEKALEGVGNIKDLCDGEKEDIKRIKHMLKSLN